MFRKNVLLTLSTEILTLAGSFLVGIMLARGLSVPERGIMALVMALPYTIAGLANLGLPQANIFLTGRKKLPGGRVLASSLVIALMIGFLAVSGLLLLKDRVLITILRGLPEEYYLPLLLLAPLLLVDGMLLSILRAYQRFDLFNLRRLASSVLLLSGFSAVLLLLRGSLQAVVVVYIGVTVFLVILSWLAARKVVPVSFGFDRQIAQASLRFGVKSYFQNLAGALNYRLDVYLLAFFLAPEQVAYYAVATAVAEAAWYLPDTVGVVLFPRLSSTPLEEIHAITARVCRSTATYTTMVALAIAASGWLLVPLVYGPAYRASVLPLMLLLPGIVFMGVYKVLTRNYSSRDRQQISIFAGAVALGLNVALNLVLIPTWGAAGAALASSAAYSAAGVLMLAAFRRDTGYSVGDVLLPKSAELSLHWEWARNTLLGGWKKLGVRGL